MLGFLLLTGGCCALYGLYKCAREGILLDIIKPGNRVQSMMRRTVELQKKEMRRRAKNSSYHLLRMSGRRELNENLAAAMSWEEGFSSDNTGDPHFGPVRVVQTRSNLYEDDYNDDIRPSYEDRRWEWKTDVRNITHNYESILCGPDSLIGGNVKLIKSDGCRVEVDSWGGVDCPSLRKPEHRVRSCQVIIN